MDRHLAKIEATDHVDHRTVIVTSPFARAVTYTLADAVHISVAHLERHRRQAERVVEASEFPRPPS